MTSYITVWKNGEEKPGKKIAIHTIWIENELNIHVFSNVNSNMIHIRYMCKISWPFFKRAATTYNT